MNKERLLQLADKIERIPHANGDLLPPGESFNMSTWRTNHECGTVACIAGHAVLMWPEDVDHFETLEINARRILGLDHEDAMYLFCGYWSDLPQSEITPILAAAELRDMAKP